MEVITVLDGQGEAWIEGGDGLVSICSGTTLVLPANQKAVVPRDGRSTSDNLRRARIAASHRQCS